MCTHSEHQPHIIKKDPAVSLCKSSDCGNMQKQACTKNKSNIGQPVLKTLILSKFTYLFLNLPDPPLEVLDELQKVMFKFLWNDKRAKIKKSVVCKPYVDGGLLMVDVYTYVASCNR
jgi:hypothetical protein